MTTKKQAAVITIDEEENPGLPERLLFGQIQNCHCLGNCHPTSHCNGSWPFTHYFPLSKFSKWPFPATSFWQSWEGKQIASRTAHWTRLGTGQICHKRLSHLTLTIQNRHAIKWVISQVAHPEETGAPRVFSVFFGTMGRPVDRSIFFFRSIGPPRAEKVRRLVEPPHIDRIPKSSRLVCIPKFLLEYYPFGWVPNFRAFSSRNRVKVYLCMGILND